MNIPSSNPRTVAAKVLLQVLYKGESLSPALSKIDSALVSDICYGCLRWHEPLSALLQELLSKQLRKKDKDVECLLRVGLYQITYQNTPDHAAVGETVSALKGLKKPWAKKLVNAVLRNYLRRQESLQKQIQQSQTVKYAFPKWLIDNIKYAYPTHWEEILLQSNKRAPMTLRVNLLNQGRTEYLSRLESAKIGAEAIEGINTAIKLDKPCNVYDLPGFSDGAVSVQDAAAQLASILLDCHDNMEVLDACAAPGGKTGHILESAKNLKVLAIDNSEQRLLRVTENLQRLKLKAEILVADALDVESYSHDRSFDRILLDAPCSATGVIRRHPDIKVLRRPSDIKKLQDIQRKMLDVLWGRVKSGGILLYATCSILPQENELQVKSFVKRHDDASVIPIDNAQGLGRQVFPGENFMDGFYYAKLKKL